MTNLRERLIQAGFAVTLEPGIYNLIYTADNYSEAGLWPLSMEEYGEGFVQLPSCIWVSAETLDHYTELMNNAQVSGYSHGFYHGVSLRTDDELGEDDLTFLSTNGLIPARIELTNQGLLVGALALADATLYSDPSEQSRELIESYRNNEFSLRELGIDADKVSYAIVLPDRVIDAYDAPGEILQLGELV